MEVVMNWRLTILEHEDRNKDDPRLQFAFLTSRDGTPITLGQRTDLLFSRSGVDFFNPEGELSEPGGGAPPPLAFTGSQSLPLPPTADSPYLAFAVRAIDEDNSSSSDRDRDFARFVQVVQNAADNTPGGTPDVDTLWRAANAPGIRNRAFKDDDDKIGVSARVYPDYGARAARAAAGSSPATWPSPAAPT